MNEFSWRAEQEKTRLWQQRIEIYVIGTHTKLNELLRKVDKIMGDLTALQTAVTNEDTVIASAITLIQGLAAQIAALPANDQAAIDALAADVGNQATALAAAVAAGTPAAPTGATGATS